MQDRTLWGTSIFNKGSYYSASSKSATIQWLLDGILINSRTKAEHLAHIYRTLALLHNNNVYIKVSQYSFKRKETEFLDHVFFKKGIHTNAGLVKAIQEWPRSTKQEKGLVK
ncbi:hypothetical protein BGZ98_000554 [Dissophora globulifera]|nr:hypothetical protein BGZ98_000554 [Dissophora globulifera]